MNFLPFLLLLLPILLPAQDTAYYNSEWKLTTDRSQRSFYVVTTSSTSQIRERAFKVNGQPLSDKSFTNTPEKVMQGTCKTWYENGKLMSEVEYENGVINGKSTRYYENGKLRKDEIYLTGTPIESHYYDENGVETYVWFENIRAEFPGGQEALNQYIASNLKYPEAALKDKTGGTVIVTFLVTEDGSIGDVFVKSPVRDDLDAEAVKVIRAMPRWKPGKANNQPVRMMMSLPITFGL
ncbi:MAG: TonB family protein [Bacteroidota bacterium]